MGGAQFFWRITLLGGIWDDGIFKLEEHTESFGMPRPKNIHYRERAARLTYDQLRAAVPYVGDDVAMLAALTLCPERRQAEYSHGHWMGV